MTAAALAVSITTGLGATQPPDRPLARTLAARAIAQTTYRGRTASEWAQRFKHRTRQLQHAKANLHDARRVLMQRPTVAEAVNLACAVYGSCSTLWRKADCESGLSPRAQNPSGASGLFQFLPSTWRSTPFGRFSVWSPYANALAAGWMHAHGRGGEWVCR